MKQQQQQLKNTRIMWHLEYWDGPQSGVLLYNNEIHYFKVQSVGPVNEDWYRKHAVYEVSDDDKIRLTTTHAIWQAHIGLHTDYWPLNGRELHPRRGTQHGPKVPCLHYGPRTDSDFAWDEYRTLTKYWEAKHGAFALEGREPIGWIYHDQLYGKDKEVEK